MKYIKIVIIAAFIGLAYFSCERDDLCPESTATTPKLILVSFDNTNQEDRKNVFGLRIQGLDNDEVLEGFNVVTEDSLVLPLRTDVDETVYKLHQQYEEDDQGNPTGGNEDTITIRYNREEVFVSRACGFKTIFKNVTIIINDDGDKWINDIEPANPNQSVENEAERHFILFH